MPYPRQQAKAIQTLRKKVEGGESPKTFSSALRDSVWSKIRTSIARGTGWRSFSISPTFLLIFVTTESM